MHPLHLCDASIIYDLFTESEPMSLVVFALCDPTDVQLAWIPPFVPVSPLFCFIFGFGWGWIGLNRGAAQGSAWAGWQSAWLAEVGSCQMEYLYLAHLTGKKEYYDVVRFIFSFILSSFFFLRFPFFNLFLLTEIFLGG